MSIRKLRERARWNLCEDCYKKYEMLHEPTIKIWLSKPLQDWRSVELHVNLMVMKLEGVFKGKAYFFSLENLPQEYADQVDEKAFRKIERWSFQRKLNYLRDHNVLSDFTYKFLDKARRIRNKIHDPMASFDEKDLKLLNNASEVTWPIHTAVLFYSTNSQVSQMFRSNAENLAKQLLSESNR